MTLARVRCRYGAGRVDADTEIGAFGSFGTASGEQTQANRLIMDSNGRPSSRPAIHLRRPGEKGGEELIKTQGYV